MRYSLESCETDKDFEILSRED
ncbi:MAG: hypothetical protein NPMRth3_3840002, partial [Nitrosopumilales archaeon]